MTGDKLNADECDELSRGFCIDCGHRGFVLGPRGGAAINIECGDVACRARFNVSSFSDHHGIAFAQRIPKQSEGGPDWDDIRREH